MARTGRMNIANIVLVSIGVVMTGCGGYESNFSCKGYPDTPYCKSVSDAYANRLNSGLPSPDQANGRSDRASTVIEPSLPTNNAMAGKAESMLGQPILKPARSFQAWVAPWKDSKRRLHESSIVYVVVENNEFVYGHVTGGVSGVKGVRPRDIYPRKGRMVEEAGMKKGPVVPSGSTQPLPSKTSTSGMSSDDFYGGSGPSVEKPSSMPQALPALPPTTSSNPTLIDDGPLGGAAYP